MIRYYSKKQKKRKETKQNNKNTKEHNKTKMMTRRLLLLFPLFALILLTLFVVPASTISSADDSTSPNSDLAPPPPDPPTSTPPPSSSTPPPSTPPLAPSTRIFSAVVVNTLEGTTYALRTKDGSLLWKIETGSPLISSTFRVGGGVGIVPGVDGSLFSLNSNGLQQFPVTIHDLLQGSYLINDAVAYVSFTFYNNVPVLFLYY